MGDRACRIGWSRCLRYQDAVLWDAQMERQQRSQDIELLARLAARLAGRNPDETVTLELGDVVAFDGPIWRYPDFLARAEAAYEMLRNPTLSERPKGKTSLAEKEGPGFRHIL